MPQPAELFFKERGREKQLSRGDVLMREGVPNRFLHFLHEGELLAYQGADQRQVLRFEAGDFVGLSSFFCVENDLHLANMTIVASGDCRLSYLERENMGADVEKDLLPYVIKDLIERQKRSWDLQRNHEVDLIKLKEQERLSSLGSFAAAVSHELNNSLAVLLQGVDWMDREMGTIVDEDQDGHDFFMLGLRKGKKHIGGKAYRDQIDYWVKKTNQSKSTARGLASMPISEEEMDRLIDGAEKKISRYVKLWSLGSSIRDMQISGRQASHVLQSMKGLATQYQSNDEDVDIAEVVNMAMSILKGALQQIDIEVDIEAGITVKGSQGDLIQVFVNLLKNSAEAIRDCKTMTRGRLMIRAHQLQKVVQIEVEDNGPGIPKGNLEKIFHSSFTTKQGGESKGLGVGLTIVFKIMMNHSGEIRVHSEPGQTIFTIDLPIGKGSL